MANNKHPLHFLKPGFSFKDSNSPKFRYDDGGEKDYLADPYIGMRKYYEDAAVAAQKYKNDQGEISPFNNARAWVKAGIKNPYLLFRKRGHLYNNNPIQKFSISDLENTETNPYHTPWPTIREGENKIGTRYPTDYIVPNERDYKRYQEYLTTRPKNLFPDTDQPDQEASSTGTPSPRKSTYTSPPSFWWPKTKRAIRNTFREIGQGIEDICRPGQPCWGLMKQNGGSNNGEFLVSDNINQGPSIGELGPTKLSSSLWDAPYSDFGISNIFGETPRYPMPLPTNMQQKAIEAQGLYNTPGDLRNLVDRRYINPLKSGDAFDDLYYDAKLSRAEAEKGMKYLRETYGDRSPQRFKKNKGGLIKAQPGLSVPGITPPPPGLFDTGIQRADATRTNINDKIASQIQSRKKAPIIKDVTSYAPKGSVRRSIQEGINQLSNINNPTVLPDGTKIIDTPVGSGFISGVLAPTLQSGMNIANLVMGDYPINSDSDLRDLAWDATTVLPFANSALKTGKNALTPVKSYVQDLAYSLPKGKLPTYTNALRWEADVIPENLKKAGLKLTPEQQSTKGSWYGYSNNKTQGATGVGFYMHTRPGPGNLKVLRLSDRQIYNLERNMPDFAKGMSGKYHSVPTSNEWLQGELVVPEELRNSAKDIRFKINPTEYAVSPQTLEATPEYLKDHYLRLGTGKFAQDIVNSRYPNIMGIPRKYFPRKKGGPIDTPYGQWEYPGEVTRIPSNRITMQGVNYPVLGVDDTGHKQMMLPGGEYHFPGSSVTEYPVMAQQGMTVINRTITPLNTKPTTKRTKKAAYQPKPEYNTTHSVEPFITSDPEEFARRKQAYADSLNLYNETAQEFKTRHSLTNLNSFIPYQNTPENSHFQEGDVNVFKSKTKSGIFGNRSIKPIGFIPLTPKFGDYPLHHAVYQEPVQDVIFKPKPAEYIWTPYGKMSAEEYTRQFPGAAKKDLAPIQKQDDGGPIKAQVGFAVPGITPPPPGLFDTGVQRADITRTAVPQKVQQIQQLEELKKDLDNNPRLTEEGFKKKYGRSRNDVRTTLIPSTSDQVINQLGFLAQGVNDFYGNMLGLDPEYLRNTHDYAGFISKGAQNFPLLAAFDIGTPYVMQGLSSGFNKLTGALNKGTSTVANSLPHLKDFLNSDIRDIAGPYVNPNYAARVIAEEDPMLLPSTIKTAVKYGKGSNFIQYPILGSAAGMGTGMVQMALQDNPYDTDEARKRFRIIINKERKNIALTQEEQQFKDDLDNYQNNRAKGVLGSIAAGTLFGTAMGIGARNKGILDYFKFDKPWLLQQEEARLATEAPEIFNNLNTARSNYWNNIFQPEYQNIINREERALLNRYGTGDPIQPPPSIQPEPLPSPPPDTDPFGFGASYFNNSSKTTFQPPDRNLGYMTKDVVEKLVNNENKGVLANMPDYFFKNSHVTPDGRLHVLDNFDIRKELSDLTNEVIPLNHKEYVKIFNDNIHILNDIIKQNNKSGFEYEIVKLTEDGHLHFRNSRQTLEVPDLHNSHLLSPESSNQYQKLTDELKVIKMQKNDLLMNKPEGWEQKVKDLKSTEDFNRSVIDQLFKNENLVRTEVVPEGTNWWTVDIRPGEWDGVVKDIPNREYIEKVPGLKMSITSNGVFADHRSRVGTNTYNSINEYLKRLNLGRVKAGLNSQSATKYDSFGNIIKTGSKEVWEGIIKSGKGYGYYNDAKTVHGIMKKKGGSTNWKIID